MSLYHGVSFYETLNRCCIMSVYVTTRAGWDFDTSLSSVRAVAHIKCCVCVCHRKLSNRNTEERMDIILGMKRGNSAS
jgi:hypothetical protein